MRSQATSSPVKRLKNQMSYFPCRHFEDGRIIIPKICIYNHECWKCAFDQWLEEIEAQQAVTAIAV